jgi:glycosyltransferase involved in cell wall biosynthesis
MKILQLYYKMPFPMDDGGAYSIYHNTLSLLSQQATVKILAMNPLKAPGNMLQLTDDFIKTTGFESIVVDNRVKPFNALLNLFTKQSYFTERFLSLAFSKRLRQILKDEHFDIILLEHLYVCLYLNDLRELSKARVVLREQNVENQLWHNYAKKVKNPLARFFYQTATRRLEIFEKQMIQQVDGIVALSPVDAAYFRTNAPGTAVAEIPVCIDASGFEAVDAEKQYAHFPVLYHLGSMDWKPNIEGMKWFVRKVVPLLKAKHPEILIYIAGKNMPGWFFGKSDKNLIVEGFVPDAVKFQEDKAILFVPLLNGSGIRVKILEGMGLAKTIVATTTAARGIPVTDGENILLADTPEAFAEAISRCVVSEKLCRSMGRNARQFATENYEMSRIGERTLVFFNKVISQGNINH